MHMAQVMAYHNVPCHAVVIGRKGTLSKTTSGKITRSTYRAAFEQRKYLQVSKMCNVFAAVKGLTSPHA